MESNDGLTMIFWGKEPGNKKQKYEKKVGYTKNGR